MKIEDCQTVNEFFGVEEDAYIWIEGEMFRVYKGFISGLDMSTEKDSQALVGCLTGQLEWSKEPPKSEMTVESGGCEWCSDLSKYRGFGYACFFEQFAVDEVHELSVEVKYCPNCGQKIEETTEETIVPAMTADEENLLREVAAWFPHWNLLYLNKTGSITYGRHNGCWAVPFGVVDNGSKAYEALAPILEKYGEINLEEYRGSDHETN